MCAIQANLIGFALTLQAKYVPELVIARGQPESFTYITSGSSVSIRHDCKPVFIP